MNQEYRDALLTIRAALRSVEPKMSSMGGSLFEDCRLLKKNPGFYGEEKERERIMRDVHMALTEVLSTLPYDQLHQLAITSKPSALWSLPSTTIDTKSNRRRLVAYAMGGLMRKLLG